VKRTTTPAAVRALPRASTRRRRTSPVDIDTGLDGSIRDQILVRAGHLFLERGFQGTSMEAIAREVGITAGALYWHFRSKVDILVQFMQWTFDTVLQRIGDDPAEPASARLRNLVVAHVRGQLEWVTQTDGRKLHFTGRQLLEALPARLRPRLEAAQGQYVRFCAELVQAGVDSGEFACAQPTPTAFAIVNMCEDVNLWFRADGKLSVEQVAQLYGDLAVRMVSTSSR
jgi:AcrR family transcriptional regulator